LSELSPQDDQPTTTPTQPETVQPNGHAKPVEEEEEEEIPEEDGPMGESSSFLRLGTNTSSLSVRQLQLC